MLTSNIPHFWIIILFNNLIHSPSIFNYFQFASLKSSQFCLFKVYQAVVKHELLRKNLTILSHFALKIYMKFFSPIRAGPLYPHFYICSLIRGWATLLNLLLSNLIRSAFQIVAILQRYIFTIVE